MRVGIGANLIEKYAIEPGTALTGSLAKCDGAQGKKPGKNSEMEVPENR